MKLFVSGSLINQENNETAVIKSRLKQNKSQPNKKKKHFFIFHLICKIRELWENISSPDNDALKNASSLKKQENVDHRTVVRFKFCTSLLYITSCQCSYAFFKELIYVFIWLT